MISTQEFKEQFYTLVDNAKNIVITSHMSPDDDSIASVLSVYQVIRIHRPDVKVAVMYTGKESIETTNRYQTFANFEKIKFVDDIANHLDGCDLLVMLDGGQYSRFSLLPEKLKEVTMKVCIDHHASSPDDFNLSYIQPSASSNAELVYQIFCREEHVDPKLAEIFLLGIIADTGNFSFVRPEQSEIFAIAKEIVEHAGISIDQLRSRYNQYSRKVFNVLQNLIKNTQFDEIINWPPFMYTFVDELFVEAGSYTESEVRSASSIFVSYYARSVEGYSWGFVITERGGEFKLSFRSLPQSVNVRDLVERMQIGGGHDRAAGGSFKKTDGYASVEACIEAIKDFMKNNKPLIS